MFCSQCGKENDNAALFCERCGCPLTKAAPVGAGVPAGMGASAGAGAPGNYAMGTAPVYQAQKGCLGQAWSDITSSPSWVKRVLTLMVMKCIPVLSIFASGYSLQWGAEAAAGKAKPLAAGSFNKKTFVLGLIVLLLGVLLSLGTLPFAALYLIPVLGVILTLAVDLLASAFYYMSAMRVGVTGKLGSAFELSDLFRAYRKNLGGLFAAAVVPSIIIAVIIVVLIAIYAVFVVMGSVNVAQNIPYTYNDYGYYGGYGNYDSYLPSVFGMLGGSLIGLILLLLAALFLTGFSELWTMRAVGYWVNRNEPQWANEGEASACAAPTADGAGNVCSGATAAAAGTAGVGAAPAVANGAAMDSASAGGVAAGVGASAVPFTAGTSATTSPAAGAPVQTATANNASGTTSAADAAATVAAEIAAAPAEAAADNASPSQPS